MLPYIPTAEESFPLFQAQSIKCKDCNPKIACLKGSDKYYPYIVMCNNIDDNGKNPDYHTKYTYILLYEITMKIVSFNIFGL